MTDAAISLQHVSKRFRLGRLGGNFWPWLLGRRQSAGAHELWALSDISFDVATGEVLGIVGANGAGKSTLLKILSRITHPTHGRIEMRGRVASLLEVGTGFHPELTGRENIFLNGSILGMHRAEIARQFDAIVDFAGIERFLDTPVKRYSSGMYIRLAFAVAAHLEPEILIVDEVLAVGDAAFQQKCLGRMQSFAGGGRTVLFVSHNLAAVNHFCSRAVRLRDGQLVDSGPPTEVTGRYISDYYAAERNCTFAPEPHKALQVRGVAVNGCPEGPGGVLRRTAPFEIIVDYDVRETLVGTELAIIVERSDGVEVLHTRDTDDAEDFQTRRTPGSFRARIEVPGSLLNAGAYMVRIVADWGPHRRKIDERQAVSFELHDDTGEIAVRSQGRPRGGVVYLDLPWALSPLAPASAPAVLQPT